MLLTNQQKCIMEILGKVGCIRRDQLLALLYGKYRERVMTMRPEHLTPMLRQLSGISHAVCVEDDVIRLITKTAKNGKSAAFGEYRRDAGNYRRVSTPVLHPHQSARSALFSLRR